MLVFHIRFLFALFNGVDAGRHVVLQLSEKGRRRLGSFPPVVLDLEDKERGQVEFLVNYQLTK